MNVLCQMLWGKQDIASVEEIDTIWHNYVKAQRHIISHDIMKLSINQRRVITALARLPTVEIQSAEFTAPLKISASSAQQSIERLIHNDLVYKDIGEFFRVLDPAMRYYLNIVLWENC